MVSVAGAANAAVFDPRCAIVCDVFSVFGKAEFAAGVADGLVLKDCGADCV